jgi:hypothetical protein
MKIDTMGQCATGRLMQVYLGGDKLDVKGYRLPTD